MTNDQLSNIAKSMLIPDSKSAMTPIENHSRNYAGNGLLSLCVNYKGMPYRRLGSFGYKPTWHKGAETIIMSKKLSDMLESIFNAEIVPLLRDRFGPKQVEKS